MNTADKDTALSFYCYLCSVIGSVEEVRARRQLYDAFDKIGYSELFVTITSGSKGEGLDLTGSDFDIMFVYFTSNGYICETSDKAQHSSKKQYLLMKMLDTKPGFTKLSLKNASDRQINDTLYVQDGDELYLSSKQFKEWIVNFFNIFSYNDFIIHGPCVSSADEGQDNAFCLRCPEWITPAQRWITRSRVSWPSNNLISSIIKNGVLLVPIGCKHSNSEDLEWRISFSVAEKQLIYTFQHTQLLCYALLKILLKELVNKNVDLKDLLCSYFLKTVMFWVSEETSVSSWTPDNILTCFMSCFQRLVYCVEIFTCSHYFFTKNNLFENKIVGLNQIRLLSYLKLLYNTGWQCLFQSKTISQIDFTELLGNSFTNYCSDKIPNTCALHNVLCYVLCFYNLHDTRNLCDSLMDTWKRFFLDRGDHLTITEQYWNECENNDASYVLGIVLHIVGDWQSLICTFSHFNNRIDENNTKFQFSQIVWPYLENIVRERFSSVL